MIGATWLGGHTEEGERFALLTFEAPSQIRFGGRRLTLERVQLEKYRLDVLTDTGPLPFEHVTAVTAGEDPPDFVVATPSGDEGIECASLTLDKRRRGYGLFDHFRARLLEAAQISRVARWRAYADFLRWRSGRRQHHSRRARFPSRSLRAGDRLPSEVLVKDQLPPGPVQTDHIRIVTMHNFMAGVVRELS